MGKLGKLKKMSEGRKMFFNVMTIFIIFAATFILFEDYDRNAYNPFTEASDWHLLLFAIVVMLGLAYLLNNYAHRMDERISREQALEQNKMRRELTQNIAHELKTPTTSILGYIETLLDNPDIDSNMRQQFLTRAHLQTQRLSSLLQDISTLNQMDHAPKQHEMKRVELSHVVADIAQETSIALQKKSMTFRNCLPGSVIVTGNPSLLYSIFRNLVDNALLYAGEGTTLTLTAKEDTDVWHFTFQDNGIGVAEEHLPRLFERFYRVDKGRSRTMGGTGLGLAIVKNAVTLHGGTITAKNAEGGGLRFDFTIKK